MLLPIGAIIAAAAFIRAARNVSAFIWRGCFRVLATMRSASSTTSSSFGRPSLGPALGLAAAAASAYACTML
eukprot:scaffold18425_cov112-Isochrysis_galbana.AAC.9